MQHSTQLTTHKVDKIKIEEEYAGDTKWLSIRCFDAEGKQTIEFVAFTKSACIEIECLGHRMDACT